MRQIITPALLSIGLLTAFASQAREVSVEITNLTNGTYFTPLLVAAHGRGTDLFELGNPASANLQAMAEGGDTSGLQADIGATGGTFVADPAGGLLAPGASTVATIEVHGRAQAYLSIVGMLLPTNDGFVGLDSVRIPKRHGSNTYYLTGYDAGTEANDEIINDGGMPGTPGVPADPGGNGGVGGKGAAGMDHNTKVHIHRGVLGDQNPTGGVSDLDSSVHRWLNPVARVVIRAGGWGSPHWDD